MYQFESRIRYSETDSSGRLSLPGLLDYFQDCSIFHSEDLGLGVEYLKEKEMIWALTFWQIVVKRYPNQSEHIKTGTAPYDFKGFIGYRNFWMWDESGREIAVANSIWSLIHMRDGKPAKVPSEMMEKYVLSPKAEMEYANRKIVFEGEGRPETKMTVTAHHLDTNLHVNNGQYVRIAMDYLPENFPIGQLRAEYKKQAVLGTEMYPVIFETEDKTGVSLQDEAGAAYCNVEFTRM